MTGSTTMSPQRWARVQALFDEAIRLPAEERAGFLAEHCGGDAELREQVAALVRASTGAGETFDRHMDRAVAGSLVALDDLQAGHLIGRYRVVRLLGRGGMGAVYLAERADEHYEQRVALKIIGRSLPPEGMARRFRAERQILAQLNHPKIARLLDGGTSDTGVPYLVMEYIEGTRIDVYCDLQQLALPARLRLFQQVCAAVQYAHQNLIVHRDIKPSNILVRGDGTPTLLDFGIAKLLDPASTGVESELTRVHERVLTPDHASPEQVRGEPIGTVSDVYALGVLLFQLLTGARPYGVLSSSLADIEYVICNVEPVKPSVAARERANGEPLAAELAGALAGDLDNIVLKAMRKDPLRRYPSAAALAEDIQNYLEDRPVQARPDAWTYRAVKFMRRNAAAVATAAAVVVGTAALVVYYTLQLAAERDAAERERQTSAAVSQFMEEVFRVANPSESRGNTVTVREVLDAAVERIDRDLQNEPRVRATLLRTMGQVYNGLGLWRQARELLERAVAQERASFGNDHRELALALASLAGVNHNLSQFETEARLYAEAWALRQQLGLDRDAEAARLLSAMSGSLRSQQRFTEALEFHQRAEALARTLVPAEPAVLGQVLQGFAMTYLIMGEHVLAERYARDSLELVKDVVYNGNDLYANSMYALAESLRKQYRLQESEELQRRLLARQHERLGSDAPLVARTWNNLSNVLRASGKYAAAEEALLEAIAIFRRQFGEVSFDLAVAQHNLGGLRHEAGDLTRSLIALEQALDLKRQLTGDGSPHLVSTQLEKVAVLRERGNLQGARALFAETKALADATFDGADRRYGLVLLEEARLALAHGDYQQAEESVRAALIRIDGQNPGRQAEAHCVLAESLVGTGRYAEARTLLMDVLASRRRIMPAGHWMIAEAQSRLGEALSRTGAAERATALLRQSEAVLRKYRPEGDAALLAAQRRLQEHKARMAGSE